MQLVLYKYRAKSVFTCLAIVFLLFSLSLAATPVAAIAGPGVPAQSLTVNIDDNGEIIPVRTYTVNEMIDLTGGQVAYYSSIDSMPAPVVTIAVGVTLDALVADINAKDNAGISMAPGALEGIKLHSTDGWSVTYTYDYLYGAARCYYPELVNKWDSDNQMAGPGADAGPVPVEPIFATHSYQKRFLTDLNPDQILAPNDEGSAAFCFCFGQTASDIAKCTVTNNKFAKWVNRVDILLPDCLPAPVLNADITGCNVDHAVEITFSDDPAWRDAVAGVTVNGAALHGGLYTVAEGKISIDARLFEAAGAYTIVVEAPGYKDATVIQNMVDLFQDWPAFSIETVPGDKTWTIRFSLPVSTTQSLNEHIYVTGANGKRVDITCETEGLKSVGVVAPKEGYQSGEGYTLWIKDSLQSASGKQLKQPVKMRFNII